MKGNVFIICAPSGAGKTSLVRELLARDPNVHLSVSHTTRAPRPGEKSGRDYYFVTKPVFQAMVGRAEFLESAEVHGNLYGTSQAWIEAHRGQGHDIVLEIDWQGAQQVRKLIPDAIGIFILPPSLDVLKQRMKDRRQDSATVIERRLKAARGEIAHLEEFDYVIINNNFDDAVEDLASIVRSARLRMPSQAARHGDLINSLK
ncbi:MAG TPA: guanylate kinase [Burkholderiales bacterium]|jgi:guanylate kinase|nr:guanylate kinase [Burkholderiales bacterium]